MLIRTGSVVHLKMEENPGILLLLPVELAARIHLSKGSGTPSATRAATRHKHGVSEAFLNCSHEGGQICIKLTRLCATGRQVFA